MSRVFDLFIFLGFGVSIVLVMCFVGFVCMDTLS